MHQNSQCSKYNVNRRAKDNWKTTIALQLNLIQRLKNKVYEIHTAAKRLWSNFKDSLLENKRKQPYIIVHDGEYQKKMVCSGSAHMELEYSQISLNSNWRTPTDCSCFLTDIWHCLIRAKLSHLPQECGFYYNASNFYLKICKMWERSVYCVFWKVSVMESWRYHRGISLLFITKYG